MKSTIIFLISFILITNFGLGQSSANFSYDWLVDTECARPEEAHIISLFHQETGTDASIYWHCSSSDIFKISNSTNHAALLSIDFTKGTIPNAITVYLDVKDNAGNTFSHSKSIDLDIHFAPIIRISPSYYETGCKPWGVEFLNESYSLSETPLTGFSWDFGDGNTSTDENPNHMFEDIGTFTIKLTVSDDTGCSSDNFRLSQPTLIEVKSTEECD